MQRCLEEAAEAPSAHYNDGPRNGDGAAVPAAVEPPSAYRHADRNSDGYDTRPNPRTGHTRAHTRAGADAGTGTEAATRSEHLGRVVSLVRVV